MEYFLLTQSKAVVNPIQLLECDASVYTAKMTHDDFAKLGNVAVAYFNYSPEVELPDILKYPTYMIADPIKKILELYNDALSFRAIQAYPVDVKDAEMVKKYAKLYWIYDCIQMDCLSKETVFLPNGEVEEIILDKKKIRPINIFRPRGLLENRLIVSLPVAESILRRNAYGVGIQPVLVK